MTMVKIEKTEGEKRVRARIIESTSVGKKIKIRERKIDRTIDTKMNERIEGEKRNDEIGIREKIRGEVIAKKGRKGEVRGTKVTIGEETTAKRDWKEGTKGTSIAIGNVGIVIARGKGPRKMRTRDTDRTSTRENDEGERADAEDSTIIHLKYT